MQYSLQYKAKIFDEMIGQKLIINEFKRRSINKDFSPVMFMEGGSGLGKTTLAFIIAKILNCKNPIKRDGYLDPCNKCQPCEDVNAEKFYRDSLFFDGSNMSKEDVLKIEKLASSSPMYDQNIIITIDEAQELSKSGKGAALKLLEKPRKNVYFILCTMDQNAFSTAIKRRGQYYKFKEVSIDEIADFLINIIKKEKLFESIDQEFIEKGIFTIAENCLGSPGLALSYLERCIYANLYKEEDIIKELGLISDSLTSNLLQRILDYDKDIFKEFSNIDLKEFFYKSFKILTDFKVFAISDWVDQEWKIKFYNVLKKYDNIDKLIAYFQSMKTDPYFNENSFYLSIINFFNDRISNNPQIGIECLKENDTTFLNNNTGLGNKVIRRRE
jgi:DNA polymerase III subunit gamma/tau